MAIAAFLADYLERRKAPEKLTPREARILRWVYLRREGQVERARGSVRVDWASGNATTLISAGVFFQRNGTRFLAYQDTAGVLRAQVKPSAAYEDSSF